MSTKASKKIAPRQKQRMPIWLPLIIIAGVALIGLTLISNGGNNQSGTATSPQVNGSPALKVDQEKIDLGNVPLGQTVEAKFGVINVGDQPLRFTKAPYIEVVEGC